MILAVLTLSLAAGSTQDPATQDPATQDPAVQEVPLARNEVEITYLANQGFLLRSGRLKFLIDAFVGESHSGYEALPPDMLAQLVNAQAPFDGSPIMLLTSHAHKDHFQPRYAEQFMLRNPGAAFISSTQVVNTLARGAEDFSKIKSLCRFMPVEPGESQRIPHKQVSLEFLNLPHGGEGNAAITNYGHLMRLGQLRILHIGDADATQENFAPYNLAARELDIVFVPYWYFTSEEGLRIINEHFNANHLIAVHFPMSEKRKLVELLKEDNPHVHVLEKSGDKKVFRAEKKE